MVILPSDELEKEVVEAADCAEEMFRIYGSAVKSYIEDDCFEWPIDGPRSTYSVLNQLRRDGRTSLQQHDD